MKSAEEIFYACLIIYTETYFDEQSIKLLKEVTDKLSPAKLLSE